MRFKKKKKKKTYVEWILQVQIPSRSGIRMNSIIIFKIFLFIVPSSLNHIKTQKQKVSTYNSFLFKFCPAPNKRKEIKSNFFSTNLLNSFSSVVGFRQSDINIDYRISTCNKQELKMLCLIECT